MNWTQKALTSCRAEYYVESINAHTGLKDKEYTERLQRAIKYLLGRMWR